MNWRAIDSKGLMILATLVTILTACATDHRLERDISDPIYHSDIHTGPLIPRFKDGEAVPAAGVAALFSREYYKSSSIAGECRYSVHHSTFLPLPCRNITVVLLTSDKKVVRRQQVDDTGNFTFFVEKDKRYLIQVPGSRLFSSYTSGELEVGERVLVKLNSKSSRP